MLPVDAHVTFQIIAVVLGAVVLWVLFVNVRLPSRTQMPLAKKAETPATKPEPAPEEDEDEKS